MKRFFSLLFLIGSTHCFAQNIIKYEYDDKGNVTSRKSEEVEPSSSTTNGKYTAKILTNPTTGPVKIEVSDKNGIVSCLIGLILVNVANGIRYDNGDVYSGGSIKFDMSDCPDGLYAVTLYVDVNSKFPQGLFDLKIVKKK